MSAPVAWRVLGYLAEGGVDFVAALGIKCDRILRIGEIEEVVAGAHEDDAIGAADFLEAEHFGIEFFRTIEVFDRNGEVENAFGLRHESLFDGTRHAPHRARTHDGGTKNDSTISAGAGLVEHGPFEKPTSATASGEFGRIRSIAAVALQILAIEDAAGMRQLRPEIEPKIHAAFDHVDILADVDQKIRGSGKAKRHSIGGKKVMVIFDKGRPIPRKGPLDANAGQRTKGSIASTAVKANERTRTCVRKLVVRQGPTGFGVKKNTIPIESYANAQVAQEIRLGLKIREGKWVSRTARDRAASRRTGHSEDKIVAQFKVTAELPPKYSAVAAYTGAAAQA
jgi:hypothetical protein